MSRVVAGVGVNAELGGCSKPPAGDDVRSLHQESAGNCAAAESSGYYCTSVTMVETTEARVTWR